MRRSQSAHVNTRRAEESKRHSTGSGNAAQVAVINALSSRHKSSRILQKYCVSGARTGENPVNKIISVNVGLPREVLWHGHTVTTGIFKEPVEGRVFLHKLDLDGDRQADLTVHGGEYKAVYC